MIQKIKRILKFNQNLGKIPIKNTNNNNQFKTTNKIEYQKLNKYEKFLKLKNKTIQRIIYRILKTIYSSYFLESGFISYPTLTTNELFNHIRLRLFWIEEVMEKSYLVINITQFCNILNKKIQDDKFTNLIHQILKYEALKNCQFFQFNLDIYQKHVILSIFMDIYFNEFDNWINYKIYVLNQPSSYSKKKIYSQLFYQTENEFKQQQKLNKSSEKYIVFQKNLVKFNRGEKTNIDLYNQQISYFRLFANWIIGLKGKKNLNSLIKVEINHFLIIYLKQQMSLIKVKIVSSSYKKVNFINYYIHFLNSQKINNYTQYYNELNYFENSKVKCSIPINFIYQNMRKNSYSQKFIHNYELFCNINYIERKNIIIIKYFVQVWVGLLNHYLGCKNSSRLQDIHYNLYLLFIKTLISTYKLNIKTIFIKHGKILKIFKDDISINFPYKTK